VATLDQLTINALAKEILDRLRGTKVASYEFEAIGMTMTFPIPAKAQGKRVKVTIEVV
jgi:hypothetical protein